MRIIRSAAKKTALIISAAALWIFASLSAMTAFAAETSSQADYQVNTSIENQVVRLSGFELTLVIVLCVLVALSLAAGAAAIILTARRKRGSE